MRPRIPWHYVARNLWVRRVTSLLTAGGMALVVFTFATVLMMSEGIRSTLVATGSADNAVLLRQGATAEISSGIERRQADVVATLPGIALDERGQPLISKEVVVLNSLAKRGSGQPANVTMRGLGAQGVRMRPAVALVEGRMFRPGTPEVVVGRAVADGFAGAGLGQWLRFGGREWQVVGVFDAGRTAHDSEIWGDHELMMQSFRRNAWSSVLLRLAEPATGLPAMQAAIAADPRLQVQAKREDVFYAEQSEALAQFIRVLGTALAVVFSIGAVVGAMITMFAAVAQRTREIGTLRALGFRRAMVLSAFLAESLLLSLVGGVAGLAGASLMQSVNISTTNFQTFAELAFQFRLTPLIAVQALLFALVMGLVGGVLPAWRAARLNIAQSLRAGS
ncbi:MAG: ABC transporter permease [Comamonadaceae bacterium]|nr:MAG: ABC transporter permease [Comamonadaceae bacterium]